MNKVTDFKKLQLRIFVLALLVLLPLSVFGRTAEIVIFHTSDIHGAISAHPDPTSQEKPKPLMGGFSTLKALMDSYKSRPENFNARFFYFDSGDYFQGTPVVDKTKGKVMIDMFNHLGLDAATLGNHEFDYTYQTLLKQMQHKKFPIVCCNLIEKETQKLASYAKPYLVFSHKGFKIGVIGIDSPETPSISVEKNIKDLIFLDPVSIVKDLVKNMRMAEVDYIILLSHLGYEADLKFLEKVEGIDLVLGGHSHTVSTKADWVGPCNTALIHPGSSLEHATVVKVVLDDDGSSTLDAEIRPLYVDEIGQDKQILELEDQYLEEIRKKMARVIGYSEIDLHRGVNGGDSPEGSFIADAMSHAVNSDFAFINFGGIRNPIFAGKITVGDAFLVQPFNNKIFTLNMTGTQLIDLIERFLSNEFRPMNEEDRQYVTKHYHIKADGLRRVVGPDYGYLHPSNLKITFDPSREPMNRIISVTDLDGNKIIHSKKYKVAISDFVANGGDGFTNLKKITDRVKSDILVRDALINYIKAKKEIKAYPQKRLINTKLSSERTN
ncbi:MAG: bifunctional metallophosphatase/5'-nucleotidase [Candidatus Rifleibacteriota bacterium]